MRKRVMKKKVTRKKVTRKKAPKKAKVKSRKTIPAKKASKRTPGRRSAFARTRPALSGAQSGDLEGLRDIESADSESVGELLEEGNAFEAAAVEGVEEADTDQERGVRTRQVPEDDVPGEYLDED